MAKICPKCNKNPLAEDYHKLCPSCFKAERKGDNGKSAKSKDKPEKSEKPKKCPYCNKRALPPDRAACLSCRPDYKITGDPSKAPDGGYEVLVQTYQNGKQVGPVEFEWQVTDGGFVRKSTDATGVAKLDISPSLKKRQLTLHVIGSEGDTPAMELPGGAPTPPVVTVEPGDGLWVNFQRGLRGKEVTK